MGSGHVHHGGSTSSQNLKTAFFLNAGFTVIEIIGGLFTNSVAILSDAVHDLGDTLSLGLAWYFDRYSKRGRTPESTYGYHRYSLLGGLITAIVLIAGIAIVLWNAIPRLFHPEEVNAAGMMGLAVIGVLFNGMAMLRVRKGTSLTEKVVSWHLLEDVLGWMAVLIGAGIMTVWDLPIIDPILSIGISLFVFWNVLRSLGKFFHVFLQKTPESFDLENFEQALSERPRVLSTHHTHSWSIDGEHHVLTTHVVMESDASRQEIVELKNYVRSMLDPHTFTHVTVDVELAGELCVMKEKPGPENVHACGNH